MQRKITSQSMKAMRKGNHRRNPNTACHKVGFFGIFDKFKMINRLWDKNLASLAKDTMKQSWAASPFIFTHNTNLIFGSICWIARHRILAQIFRCHHNIKMSARAPFWQITTIKAFELIHCDSRTHRHHFADLNANNRRIISVIINMKMVIFTAHKLGFIFFCCDHRLISLYPLFAIHRIGIGVWMRRKMSWIDCQCLIFIFQIKVSLKIAPIDRLFCFVIAAICIKGDIPPPFFSIIETALAHCIIKPCQSRGEFRGMHGSKAKWLFCK